MGGMVFKLIAKTGKDKLQTKFTNLNEIPSVDIDGNAVPRLGELVTGKKCVMVVNVATK